MFRFAVLSPFVVSYCTCVAAGEDEVSSMLSVRAVKKDRQPLTLQPYEMPAYTPTPPPYHKDPPSQPYEPPQPYKPLQPYEPPQPYEPEEPRADVVVGSFITDDTLQGGAWVKRYEFSKQMSQPPVIVGLMSDKGSHPANIRFFDVDANGFTAGVVESKSTHRGGDGPHNKETVHYIAAVPGVTEMDGLTIEAGKVETQESVGSPQFAKTDTPVTGGWEKVQFTAGFTQKPAFLSGLQTTNNRFISFDASPKAVSPWLASAAKSVKSSSAKVSLERCEVMDGSRIDRAETIGWIALAQGRGNANGVEYSVKNQKTGKEHLGWDDSQNKKESVTFHKKMEDAIAVASMSSRNGNNGGWLRSLGQTKKRLYVAVDEDNYNDEEREHLPEDVSFAAFAGPFAYP